jgi:hypothetical protein
MMRLAELGFVVVEFNQVGGSPRVVSGDIWDEEDARDVKEQAEAETRKTGRRERYAVARLTIEEATDA